jgi:hypothetical protein
VGVAPEGPVLGWRRRDGAPVAGGDSILEVGRKAIRSSLCFLDSSGRGVVNSPVHSWRRGRGWGRGRGAVDVRGGPPTWRKEMAAARPGSAARTAARGGGSVPDRRRGPFRRRGDDGEM